MSRMLVAALALLAANAAQGAAQASADFLPPEQAFRVSAHAESQDRVRLSWEIADGYYLYRDRLRVHSLTTGIEIDDPTWPTAKLKQDPYFGEVRIYRDQVTVPLPVQRADATADELRLAVTHQGCADAGLCYPPQEQVLRVSLPPAPGPAAPTDTVQRRGDRDLAPLSGLLARSSATDELLPVEEAFRVSATAVAPDQILVTWDIAPETFLYQEHVSVSLEDAAGVALGELTLPAAEVKPSTVRPDGEIGDVPIYRDRLVLEAPVQRTETGPTEVTLVAAYQGCAELGVCYPPQVTHLRVALPALTGPPSEPRLTAVDTAAPQSESDRLAGVLATGNLWAVVALFFGLGILLSLTPCVLPMVPILSGIIVGQGEAITTRRAFSLSLVYVLAMASTYTVAGVLAGLFGANLQAALQNVWVLTAFALIFVALALSMFGLYDLQLPSSLQTRLTELSQRQRGGTLTGVAIMGLLSALIVGPCLAPPLAGALIFIGQTGDAALGGVALFALSLGMGAPLIAVGTTAGKLLPRAGTWMDVVKAVFGVLLLAVAIWLMERVLPPAVAMGLWGLLLICSAVYMGALQSVAREASGWHRLWRGLGLVLLIYGTLMLVGAAAGGKDTLQPLRGLAFGGAEPVKADFRPIETGAELDREIAAARARARPVMLELYADWCVTCKELERHTFSDPEVIRALERFVLLRADVTANDAEDRALLQDRFGLPGPPAILFFGLDGQEQRGYRIVGFVSASAFVEHVREVAP